MLTLAPDVLTAKRRPHVNCPKCHKEAELLAVWEVGSAGDRLLGAELRCPKCLTVLGRTAPGSHVAAPEPPALELAQAARSRLYGALLATCRDAQDVAEVAAVRDDAIEARDDGKLTPAEADALAERCAKRVRKLTGGRDATV